MSRQQNSRADRIRYYRAATDFWYEAISLQKERCLQKEGTKVQARADLNFYVVSLQRLREVARQAHKRLRLQRAKRALDSFDNQWPRLKELRDSEEHILGPVLNAPAGIHYLGGSVADLQLGGRVEYIVHVEDMELAIDTLYQELCELFKAELGAWTT